jgi:hypothetical protein
MSSRPLVIDDHLLLQLLLGHESPDLRPLGASIFTTGLWYHRLCRALADDTVTGALSRSLGNVQPRLASDTVRAIIELPDSVGLVSLQDLGWPMAQLLARGLRLNLLSLEALSAAEHLQADLCLGSSDINPSLCDAAAQRGISVRIIETCDLVFNISLSPLDDVELATIRRNLDLTPEERWTQIVNAARFVLAGRAAMSATRD